VSNGGRSAPPEIAQQEQQIGRTLRQSAHEVAVPVLAERHQYPHGQPLSAQGGAEVGADPVEHLDFEAIRGDAPLGGPIADARDQTFVVRREARIDAPAQGIGGQQPVDQSRIGLIDVAFVGVRDLARLAIGALAESDGGAQLDQSLDVGTQAQFA